MGKIEKRILYICTGDRLDNMLVQKIAQSTELYGAIDTISSPQDLMTALASPAIAGLASSIDVIIGFKMPPMDGFTLYESLPEVVRESGRVIMIAVHLTRAEHQRLENCKYLIFVEKNLLNEGLEKILKLEV